MDLKHEANQSVTTLTDCGRTLRLQLQPLIGNPFQRLQFFCSSGCRNVAHAFSLI